MTGRRFTRLGGRWRLVLGAWWVAAGAVGCAPAAPEPAAIRVVTYNIRHGRGMDDVLDITRAAAVLQRLDPDIAGLQEVDNGVERSGGVDEAEALGRTLGMHHAFGSFFDYQGGQYGMAILSRYPVAGVTPLRLPDGNEPRIALAVTVTLPDGSALTVVNVHFDWVEDDRFRFAQASALTGYLDALVHPYIVLGDFNDQPDSRTLGLFTGALAPAAKPQEDRFTFSSIEPVREIDYIFLSPPGRWTVRSVRVIDERVASDHRPVFAEITLRPAGDRP